jgi:riboflavin synthase alpha subunit
MKETLRITNLGDIQVGDEVNVERRRNSVMKSAGI